MGNELSELIADEEPQTGYIKTNETFSPVIVTEGVGTIFLGLVSIILIATVGILLTRNRKLEDRLRELGGRTIK
jgi:hypothetical protein